MSLKKVSAISSTVALGKFLEGWGVVERDMSF